MLRKSSLLLTLILTVLFMMNTGCSSIRARNDQREDQWTVYPGIKRDVADLGDAFGGKIKGDSWSPAVVVPILLADMPCSTAMDTVALPYDLFRMHDQQ